MAQETQFNEETNLTEEKSVNESNGMLNEVIEIKDDADTLDEEEDKENIKPDIISEEKNEIETKEDTVTQIEEPIVYEPDVNETIEPETSKEDWAQHHAGIINSNAR